MKIGSVYRLRGGLVLRYHGPWGGKGPCLAFQSVSEEVSDPPVGYSAAVEAVLGEVTAADLPWIRERSKQAAARGLVGEVENMNTLIKEFES